jgi:NhaP-type Na+/H+ or K+/H+ antiporter
VDRFVLLFVVAGALLVTLAVAGSVLKRLPLTAAMLYLVIGAAIGAHGVGLLRFDLVKDAALLERITEIAVLVSLFTAGLKLRLPLRDEKWRVALRLASVSMVVTIGVVTAVAHLLLHMPIGAALLLAAILAPTDPVLASDVQVADAGDRDRVRFSLTGEAGLNDGAAFPFVMLGLGLLGLHDIAAWDIEGARWLAVDVAWAIAAGLAVGALLGQIVGAFVLYLRRAHREAVGLDDFLALGLIALSYGVAELVGAYGFLAVFAAGVALRRIERRNVDDESSAPTAVASPLVSMDARAEAATDAKTAPAFMAQAVLVFNEQIERIGEIFVVLLIGGLLSTALVSWDAALIVIVLLFVARPVASLVGLAGSKVKRDQRALIAWFGVRGVGSLYYLTYSITHGLPEPLALRIGGIVLAVLTVSIVVHGISVTPMMKRYARRRERAAVAA